MKVYTGKLTQLYGYVVAEITSNDDNTYEFTKSSKSFGWSFNSTPREKDWIKAKKWVNDSLSLIEKYDSKSTVTYLK